MNAIYLIPVVCGLGLLFVMPLEIILGLGIVVAGGLLALKLTDKMQGK